MNNRDEETCISAVITVSQLASWRWEGGCEPADGWPVTSRVTLEVFDVTGRRVRTLFNGPMITGEHVIEWNGRNDLGHILPFGIYFHRAERGGASHVCCEP